MELNEHLRVTGTALKQWFLAQTLDAAAVALIWLGGLMAIEVPWAPLWAFLGFLFQYVPGLGPVLTVVGPAIAAAVYGGGMMFVWVLILYAAVAVVDGLVMQPYFMRSTARVPFWATIVVPVVLGLLFSFWGVVVAAPLLAVVYAYRARRNPHPARSQTT